MESSAGVLTGAKMLNNCSQKYVCACICLPLVCSPISAHALTHTRVYLSLAAQIAGADLLVHARGQRKY
jgi:hypothetical protein